MTPTEIETYARAKYNATGDTFFTSAEIYYYIYQAELELAAECNLCSAYTTQAVVNGTRQYTFPTLARILKRVECLDSGGTAVKLEPITFREDDALTLVNVASTTKGRPAFYSQFNFNIYLRPVPDASYTLNIYYYAEPAVVTSLSVLEVPTMFHMDLCDFVVREMYAKDKEPEMYDRFDKKWQMAKLRIKRWLQKQKRGDAFTIVMNEDNLAVTLTGPV